MRYTLRQLEVFLAAARHENISRAADTLALSQSAASGALKELERQFDVQLFDRIGKRVQLNDFGRQLRPKAMALLEQARELEQELITHQSVGRLQLGATLTIGNYLATDLMARYMAQVPEAQISLTVANTAAIADEILNFELDVGLIEGELNHPDLELIRWHQDELQVFSGPDHPWAQQPALSDADLRAARWILREPGSGTRQTFEWAMHGLLPDIQVALELQHSEAIKRAVAAGLGVGCLSRITLEEEFARGTLVPLAVPERDLSRWFYIVLHRKKYRSAGLQRWLGFIRSV